MIQRNKFELDSVIQLSANVPNWITESSSNMIQRNKFELDSVIQLNHIWTWFCYSSANVSN